MINMFRLSLLFMILGSSPTFASFTASLDSTMQFVLEEFGSDYSPCPDNNCETSSTTDLTSQPVYVQLVANYTDNVITGNDSLTITLSGTSTKTYSFIDNYDFDCSDPYDGSHFCNYSQSINSIQHIGGNIIAFTASESRLEYGGSSDYITESLQLEFHAINDGGFLKITSSSETEFTYSSPIGDISTSTYDAKYVSVSSIPLPASIWLFASAIAALSAGKLSGKNNTRATV